MNISHIYYLLLQHCWRNYYLATPLFLLLDLFFGISIRIPFLDNWPILKYIYYMMIFFLGLLISYKPQGKFVFIVWENVITIGLLIVGFLYPYVMIRDIESVKVAMEAYRMQAVINFGITAFMLYFGMYQLRFKDLTKIHFPNK